MKDKIKGRRKWLFAAAGLAVAVALKYAINIPEDVFGYSNSVLSLLVWVVYAAATEKLFDSEVWQRRTRPFVIAGAIFSLLFVGAMLAGVQLDTAGTFDLFGLKRNLVLLTLTFAAAPYVTLAMEKLTRGGVWPAAETNGT